MIFKILWLVLLGAFVTSAFVTDWLSDVGALLGDINANFFALLPWWATLLIVGFVIAVIMALIDGFSGRD